MKIENLKEQFKEQMECAKRAGIYKHTILAFGSLLGFVRERGFISHDDDMDIGFLGDKVTADQINAYCDELKKAGLFKYREKHAINPVNGKHWWISLRKHHQGAGYKCCTWGFFEHKGFMWHHKGAGTLVKGLPARYMKIGPEIEFLGTKIHIPRYAGAALDYWYPDWNTPRRGIRKSYGALMTVKNWDKRKSWVINEGD